MIGSSWTWALVLGTLAASDAAAETVFESFESGFGVWAGHGYIACQPDCPFEFSVTRTQERAHDGQWSLDFTANGFHDDGTVWIQRAVELTPGTWDVRLEFQFFSFQSDFNNWQVVGYIGLDPPEVEQDFTVLGFAGIGGWSPYYHAKTLVVDAPCTAYVALGYNITWETIRTHWFDSVEIRGIPPQPTPGDLNGDGVVGIEDFLLLLGCWGPCPDPCLPACTGDINGDCTVGIEDLLTLLANWG
jgi:hypothetical protein